MASRKRRDDAENGHAGMRRGKGRRGPGEGGDEGAAAGAAPGRLHKRRGGGAPCSRVPRPRRPLPRANRRSTSPSLLCSPRRLCSPGVAWGLTTPTSAPLLARSRGPPTCVPLPARSARRLARAPHDLHRASSRPRRSRAGASLPLCSLPAPPPSLAFCFAPARFSPPARPLRRLVPPPALSGWREAAEHPGWASRTCREPSPPCGAREPPTAIPTPVCPSRVCVFGGDAPFIRCCRAPRWAGAPGPRPHRPRESRPPARPARSSALPFAAPR